ncbi:transporter substrate-binding domain-containing protein [Kaistia dalseonensis]|uniref:Polar amino acid transport system substrate-binding protein n=1 Tax=Kaistia dalseonensis TaxID=410840 RepID=A0ABU0H785_9HYPH|nr:transporter substrate-binding domain-containing protein [Kaistia dalseonensis]MCX5495558.1 transporter substrate-binding domain-containing protein [Kaistia dalseonensis]MDQ0438150.1 polar amino acid transport system substrate-binding protein [Kaistia dalseonensis]
MLFKDLSRLLPALGLAVSFLVPLAAQAEDAYAPLQKDPAAAALLPESIKASGILKLGTDAHYPPCEYFADDNKTILGFGGELWRAMGQKLGVEVKPESIDFSGLIPGIKSGRFDLAIECITDTAERQKEVTFVDYSYDYGNSVYYMASNTAIKEKDFESLCGLKTAGQSGTNFIDGLKVFSDYCIAKGKPPIQISEVPQASAVMIGVYAGRFDFALGALVAFDELQKAAPAPIASFPNTLGINSYMGAIVNKDNKALADALLAALKGVIADGAYDKIWDKYKVAHAKLLDPGINLATERPIKAAAN